ncbi:NAD dependent epimerase/dehydratase [Mycena maculata]|uniref:NAD dependent epimerase/dehydratase n=1 Tax=Mycena maculata TaxID=230809 RepID=A0AAD7IJ19_9AGAR|nr:NAD dependent epimerase/dehydratase [Mycena maculata]
MPKFLITTATGRQGTSTTRLLLAKGAEVNALVRNPTSAASLALQSMGATLFKGDSNDIPAVTAAMQGVNGIFLSTIPNFTDPASETHQAENVLAAAHAAGTVTSVVVSTAWYTNLHEDWSVVEADFPVLSQFYASKSGVERIVRAAGFTYTIIRPGSLMRNWIAPVPAYHFPEYMSSHQITVSYPRDFRMDQLDAADVGQVAAAVLLEPPHFAGAELTLLGPEALTFDEIVAHLSEAIGEKVTVKYRTAEETAEARKTVSTVDMQVWSPTVPRVEDAKLAEYGFHWTTFKEFLEREKTAIRKTVGVEV